MNLPHRFGGAFSRGPRSCMRRWIGSATREILSLMALRRGRQRPPRHFTSQISARQTRLASSSSTPLPSGRAAACSTFQGRRDCLCTRPIAEQTISHEESVEQPLRSRLPSHTTRDRSVGGSTQNWRLILRVFLPFVAAYYLSFLFRTINATVSGSLTAEFGLGAGDLGLLTSVYYLTFAAAQIPIGILLDRYGPGRIQSAVMVAAALGAALFAISDNFWLLLGGRALIGLGVAASLTAGLKALVLWFPSERIPLLNGLMIMFGALGAVTATLPAEFLLVSMGWRALFALLAIVSAGCALFIYFVVPQVSAAMSVAGGPNSLRMVYADP